MLIFLLVAVTILLAYLGNLLHAVRLCAKVWMRNVKLTAEREMSCINDLSTIERAMQPKFQAKTLVTLGPCGVESPNNLVGMIDAKAFVIGPSLSLGAEGMRTVPYAVALPSTLP
jgi:hypothetical protein